MDQERLADQTVPHPKRKTKQKKKIMMVRKSNRPDNQITFGTDSIRLGFLIGSQKSELNF